MSGGGDEVRISLRDCCRVFRCAFWAAVGAGCRAFYATATHEIGMLIMLEMEHREDRRP